MVKHISTSAIDNLALALTVNFIKIVAIFTGLNNALLLYLMVHASRSSCMEVNGR
jgi:hypothetical protein